jgi:hypothetical protein
MGIRDFFKPADKKPSTSYRPPSKPDPYKRQADRQWEREREKKGDFVFRNPREW